MPFRLSFLPTFFQISSILICQTSRLIRNLFSQDIIVVICLDQYPQLENKNIKQYSQIQIQQHLKKNQMNNIIRMLEMGNECNICERTEGNKLKQRQNKSNPDETVQPINKPVAGYRPSMTKQDKPYFDGGKNNDEAAHPNKNHIDDQNKLVKKPPVRFNNGIVYEGSWRGDAREGYGVQYWPDGARYEGNWQNNKANGKGKFTHIDGDVYDGDWLNDKASGFGTYYHNNGAKYEGHWLDDQQHGYGVEVWVDGSRYQGNYDMGKKSGKGKYVWKDGSYYDGDWLDNRITGKGKYSWSDGRKYQGDWLNNQMHGRGRYQWKDGRKYDGQYQFDKKHGIGQYTWADGRKYVGQWVNSKRHGEGKIIHTDGTQKLGLWQNDKRLKWIGDQSEVQRSEYNI